MTKKSKPQKKIRPSGPSESAQKQLNQKLDSLLEEEITFSDEELQEQENEIRADNDLADTIDQSKVSHKKQKQRKKQIKYGIIFGILVLLGYGISRLFIPYQGHQTFAICKTFLELNVQYPTTIRLSEAFTRGNKVRIWFSHLDGFGQYKIQQIQCIYGPDEKLPYKLESVAISSVTITSENRDRWEIDAEKIKLFNKAVMPFLITYDLDLTLPWPLPNRIRDLKFETHLFRRPIF